VSALDPTGAGDAFAAGFIGMLIKGLGVEDALAFANGLGAWKTERIGRHDTIPTEQDIWDYIGERMP
jgi:sugar/nucleoside kinase (ribokinase family)